MNILWQLSGSLPRALNYATQCNAMALQAQCVSHFNGPLPGPIPLSLPRPVSRVEGKALAEIGTDWDSDLGMEMRMRMALSGSGFLWAICNGIHFQKFIADTLGRVASRLGAMKCVQASSRVFLFFLSQNQEQEQEQEIDRQPTGKCTFPGMCQVGRAQDDLHWAGPDGYIDGWIDIWTDSCRDLAACQTFISIYRA